MENQAPPPLPEGLPETEPAGGLLARVDRAMSRISPTAVERASIAVVLGLGLVDYSLGPDPLFSVAYLLPIGATAWYGTHRSAYFVCGIAALVWLGADSLARDVPLPRWMGVWNVSVRSISFLTVAALASRLREAIGAIRKLALSDPLTRLSNARAFHERLGTEVNRADRYGSIFTLAYLDLDRFKEVNDTLGHAEGDEVLRTVADTMRRTMRTSDVMARLGGDEFGILLPETPFGKAEQALVKLRTELLAAMAEGGWPVTASVGAVTFEAPATTASEAMKIADALMYEAKESKTDGIRHVLWTGEPAADSR